MPDYPITQWFYGRTRGNLRAAGDICSVRIGGQTLGTAKGGGQTNVWVTELGAGSGQFVGMAVFDDASSSTGKKLIITKGARSCARQGWNGNGSGSKRYAFNSCLRTISLGYRPQVSTTHLGEQVKTVPGLELALTVGQV